MPHLDDVGQVEGRQAFGQERGDVAEMEQVLVVQDGLALIDEHQAKGDRANVNSQEVLCVHSPSREKDNH